MALGSRRKRRETGHAELRSLVFDGADAARVDIDTRFYVGDESVCRPAIPELASDGDEFFGAVVSVGVVQEAAAAEVLTSERVRRRDHVPAARRRIRPHGGVVASGEVCSKLNLFAVFAFCMLISLKPSTTGSCQCCN